MNTKRAQGSQGFTLIEILVVIAIIGILSSVILASLNSARGKGADAAVKSNLANLRAQAELYYDTQTPNSYKENGALGFTPAKLCTRNNDTNMFGNKQIRAIIESAAKAAGTTISGTTIANTRCWTDGNDYAVSVKLKTSSHHWCVDSRGSARRVNQPTWAGPQCPPAS